eukprot:236642_1
MALKNTVYAIVVLYWTLQLTTASDDHDIQHPSIQVEQVEPASIGVNTHGRTKDIVPMLLRFFQKNQHNASGYTVMSPFREAIMLLMVLVVLFNTYGLIYCYKKHSRNTNLNS